MNILLNIDEKFLKIAQTQADKVHRLRKNYLELLLQAAIGNKTELFEIPVSPAKQASLNAKKALEKNKLRAAGIKDITLFDNVSSSKKVQSKSKKGGKNVK